MGLETLVAGRYTGAYASVDVGITEDGYDLSQDAKAEIVNQTDAYQTSIIDFVYGGGDVYLQFTSKAYKAGSITPFWPFAALGIMGIIGRLASDIASSMLLTATAGTPAATSPATLTGTYSILSPNNPARLLFTSKVRNVPVRLLVLPYSTGGAIKWFLTSAILLAIQLLGGDSPV